MAMELVIDVGSTLNNPTGKEVVIRIPVGSVMETGSAASNRQNVVIMQDYRFTVPPGGWRKVLVRGRCLNRNRRLPTSTPGRVTPFRYTGSSLQQAAIWDTVSRRGIER